VGLLGAKTEIPADTTCPDLFKPDRWEAMEWILKDSGRMSF